MFVLNNLDVSDILACERLFVMVEGLNGHILFNVVNASINYMNYQFLMAGVLPGYQNYAAVLENLKNLMGYSVNMVHYEKLTDIELAKVSRENELRNFSDVFKQRNFSQLEKRLAEIDKDNVPVIIVSAGPSLDKNINELKRAKGKSFMIVVDTALKAMLRAGIQPDLTICIDPRKEIVFFKHDEVKYVPALFAVDIPSEIIEDHEGIRFYYGDNGEPIVNMYADRYGKDKYQPILAGGSVANVAFSVASMLGFKRVVLVGQDLAFTGGKSHTKDAYDDAKKDKSEVTKFDDSMIEVEDIYGGTVLTEPRMKSYIEWFENSIVGNPEMEVIDATEGGALIRGTKIMTLANAIDEYCRTKVNIDSIINDIPEFYTKDEQAAIVQELLSLDEKLDEIANKFTEGIKEYRKLDFALKNNNKKSMQDCLKKIAPINSYAETEPWMSLILKYCVEDKYRSRDELSKSQPGDADILVKEGISLLESYIRGINSMKEQLYLMKDNI